MKYIPNIFLFQLLIQFAIEVQAEFEYETLHYITVASTNTDGFKQFTRSANVYGFSPKILGMGKKWLGGDMKNVGGGYKINLIRKELEKFKNEKNLIVLYTDSFDVIVTGGPKEIVTKFHKFGSKVVFSAEDFCWPDSSLNEKYPLVLLGYQFLNSGGFIGYANILYKLISEPIDNTDDDQLYYTKKFLDKKTRDELEIRLDTQAQIFQNLHGNIEDVALSFEKEDTRLVNLVHKTTPVVIHGNGPTKVNLNSLGNYLAKSYVKQLGCLSCLENIIDVKSLKVSDHPVIFVGVFVAKPTPFLEEMLQKVNNLDYPKQKIHLFIYNFVLTHEKLVAKWYKKQLHDDYASVKYISSLDHVKDWHARRLAIEKCLDVQCDAYFNVDSEVHLDNPETLKLLVSYNRSVIAPMMTRTGKLWSNFWGAVTSSGFYAKSTDYEAILNRERIGIWNVPYIYGAYLISKSVLRNHDTRPNYVNKLDDQDTAMASNFRNSGVFMYVVNIDNLYGHLVNDEQVATEHLYNDLWQVAANPLDWVLKYLHPDYYNALRAETNNMPCNDVYWIPLFSKKFCRELIDTMEHFGQWSGGKNEDPRLAGGYENVPTDDIHMNQINYEQEWLYILKTFVKPFAEKIFVGYTSEARSIMNFVVKYEPTRQPLLRPHHDSSTYTINVGLNRPGIDYTGGGAHFIRHNCSVTATKVGWALMHPGRLTHYHEGLPTLNGTRYILVSFIDP